MSMQAEWKDRIRQWKNELKRLFYREMDEITFEGFLTSEFLPFEQACQHQRSPFPAGTRWGKAFEYGWFFGEYRVPETAAGKKLVLNLGFGTEGTVFVNGEAFGTYRADWVRYPHQYMCDLVLSDSAVAGEVFQIAFEAYAGHGDRSIMTGPLSENRPAAAPVPAQQAVVGRTTVGEWCEDAYQLFIDLSTLIDVRNGMEEDSLRVMRIDKALKQFTNLVDYEQPIDGILKDIQKAREMLRPLLECTNGSTTPEMAAFGHSHLDIAWLWPVEETKHKCARTFSTQLKLMEMYPEYRFLQSQPYLYEQTRERYPELYERICRKVENGQFIPEGGMWVEADTNMTGGESLIRQFLYGKQFFKEEFGVESRLLWLPDVFGYTAALPQIMKGCGVDYFTTQKILNPYNDCEPFPYNYFSWRGIDGSEVTVFIHEDYTADTRPKSVINRWKNRRQKEGNESFLYPFGYGDGGAGPTREHLEYARRLGNLEGVPKVKICSPVDFFEERREKGDLPEHTFCGEIYFPAHRGVYTSQAKTKKGNRAGEFAIREAEIWSAWKQNPEAAESLRELYKTLLLNQFHDILPGSAIARVYEVAEQEYADMMEQTAKLLSDTLQNANDPENSLSVFNSLSWEREVDVRLPDSWKGAVTEDGQVLKGQRDGDGWKVRVLVPSMGCTVLHRGEKIEEATAAPVQKEDGYSLENPYLLVKVDAFGQLVSVWDKETGSEWLAGTANRFCMYRDTPRIFDAWDIDSMYEQSSVELPEKAVIEIGESGALYQSLRVMRKLNNSWLKQEIRLGSTSRHIDFVTEIDWQESHKLLKVNFPLDIQTDEMLNEIQFGYIRRPMHQSRTSDADRFEVCQHKWSAMIEAGRGAALLNDCKYGISGENRSLNLTLLKAAKAPDPNADIGKHTFCYSLYCWNTPFLSSQVIQKAYELNTGVCCVPRNSGTGSYLSVEKQNVIAETIKYAHDGSGDLILRLYESKNTRTTTKVWMDLAGFEVYEADMLEQAKQPLVHDKKSVSLDFSGFEIKTLRLVDKKKSQ